MLRGAALAIQSSGLLGKKLPMSPITRAHHKFLDSLYIGALALYILAGMMLTPFHGDESSIIYMSRDWYTLAFLRQPSFLFYRDPPPDPKAATDQQLRLVNGSLSSYTIGLAWSLAGMTAHDINDQWLWGADWNYNRDNGHIPGDKLLFVARLSSTLLTALSTAVVFAMGRRLGGRNAAWISAFVYATMPAVLLNGRRAMFEGTFLLMTALVILIGLVIAQQYVDVGAGLRPALKKWLLLGLVSGLAVSSKHTALLIIIPVFSTLLWLGRRNLSRILPNMLSALALAGFVFLILNPVWWSAPLEVPREVLRLRQELLNGQVEHFGAYTSPADRLGALVMQPLGSPQYYEDRQGWPAWIGGQISAYESAGPLTVGFAWGWIGAVLGVAGLGTLLRGITRVRAIDMSPLQEPAHGTFVFLNVVWFTALALLILTPLAWQRYYLPLAALWAVLIGVGVVTLGRFVRSRYAR